MFYVMVLNLAYPLSPRIITFNNVLFLVAIFQWFLYVRVGDFLVAKRYI